MKYFSLLILLTSFSLSIYSQTKNKDVRTAEVFTPQNYDLPKDTNFAVSVMGNSNYEPLLTDTSLSVNKKPDLLPMSLLIYVGEIDQLSKLTVKLNAVDTSLAFKLNLTFVYKMLEGKHYLIKGKDQYEVVNSLVSIPEKFPFAQQISIDATANLNKGKRRYFKTNF